MAQKLVNLGGYDIGNTFVILGSGDVGMIMARQLKLLGKDVLAVLEKEDRCGGLERNRINCLENYNIPLRTRCTVSEIRGAGRIAGVTVRDLASGHEEFLSCDTLITSVGLIPERELSEEASADRSGKTRRSSSAILKRPAS
jgi:thioredoxin reductase